MILDAKDTNRIWQALEAQPAKMIRLTTGDQKTNITGWNPAKIAKKDFFETTMKPFLVSDKTSGGKFLIQGRNDTHSKPIILIELEKEGAEIKETRLEENGENTRLKANQNLLSENADYKYKCKYLEQENESLKKVISDLQNEIAVLSSEIEELEETALLAEEEQKPAQLSEMQQVMLSAAAPLIPKLSEFLGMALDRFLTNNPNQQPQPEQAQQSIQYPINYQVNTTNE
jgi:hypothetical protein